MKKSVPFFVLNVITAALIMGMTVSAADNSVKLALSSNNTILSPGDTVMITLSVKENTGFVTLDTDIEYDKNVFTPVSKTSGVSYFLPDLETRDISTDRMAKNLGAVKYSLGNDTVKTNYTGTGTVATVVLKVNDNVKNCTTQIKLGNVQVLDVSMEDVAFNVASTALIITNEKVDAKFNDIKSTDWFESAVQFVYDNGIMAGTGDAFKPNNTLTREQFTQVLYNHSGKPIVTITNKFPDVKDDWYTKSVLWANESGIASGKGSGNFGVGEDITREELALMLYRYAKIKGFNTVAETGAIEGFMDTVKVSGWAQEALNWAVSKGIMSGKGTPGADKLTYQLDPQGKATRAECASMMKKLLSME